MTATNSATPKPTFRQRATHELKDYLIMSGYLAVLFCAISAYTQLLLSKYDVDSELTFTFALINALVIGKVILLGEMMHLGRRIEARPLYQFVLLKSILFTLLVFAFHLVEEVIKRIYHHLPNGTVLHKLDLEKITASSIIILCAFIPLFAFRELGRALGPGRLSALFSQPAPQPFATEPARSLLSPLPSDPTSPAPVQPKYP
jgi:drug/metabolite transporter (DMT)-like permease